MTISYSYDSTYNPAAPIVHIGLSPSGQMGVREEITALVDSGADATMIPVQILRAAGARYVEQRQMRGVVGQAVRVNLYLTAVHLGGYVLHGIRVIGLDHPDEAIIGRDVLNQLELVLNGPALETLVK